jgi:hypothetical protein
MKGFYKIVLKVFMIFISTFLFSVALYAQTYEAGGFVGLGLYKGDITPIPNPANPGYNIQALGRYNIDNYSVIRLNFAGGRMSGNDKYNPSSLAANRQSAFSTSVLEWAVMYEHNFYPYRRLKEFIKTTPFVFGGVGLMGFGATGGKESSSVNYSPVIPFGVGTKTALTKTLNLNIEFGTRKTFTDYLDNTHDVVNNQQNGFKNTFDWYSFCSIGLTYTFYTIICPQPLH